MMGLFALFTFEFIFSFNFNFRFFIFFVQTENGAERERVMDETAPLLLPSGNVHPKTRSICSEVSDLALKSIPICLSFAIQNIVQAVSILFAGPIGEFELEVASYGFRFTSCTGSMVAIGGATALDTLCGQAWSRASEEPQILGALLQQSLLILVSMFSIIIASLWMFSMHLFRGLGQEEIFATATGQFMRYMIPAGLLQVIAECLKRFLQLHGASYVVGWMTFGSSLVSILTAFLLTRWTNLRLWGIPITFTVYQFLTVILLMIAIHLNEGARKSWRRSSTGLAGGLSRVLFLALTGIMTIATEWWR